jgi:hypothetical protein
LLFGNWMEESLSVFGIPISKYANLRLLVIIKLAHKGKQTSELERESWQHCLSSWVQSCLKPVYYCVSPVTWTNFKLLNLIYFMIGRFYPCNQKIPD